MRDSEAVRPVDRTSPRWLAIAIVGALVAAGIVVAVRKSEQHVAVQRGPAPAPTSGPAMQRAAAARLASALAAARAAHWVRTVSVLHAPQGTVRFVDDDGPTQGRQRITLPHGEHAQVRVIGRTSYFTGNAGALANFFNLPQQAVTTGGWFEVRPGDPDYDNVTAGVTLDATLGEFAFDSAGLTLLPERSINGVRVFGIRGTPLHSTTHAGRTPEATLWVRAGSRPLPVQWTLDALDHPPIVVTFARWGESVSVTAPPGAVRLASVLRGTAT